LTSLAALLTVLLAGASGRDTLSSPYWTKLSHRPSEADMYCAGFDYPREWTITIRDGEPIVSRARPARRVDPLPFSVPKDENRSGDRHVLRLAHGWLVGFDAGEFGGGLWFTATGKEWRRIRPPADAPSNPQDPFKAENVLGLILVQGQVMALMGLDHLTGRSGRVFHVILDSEGVSLGTAAVLDSSPAVWQVVGDHLELVTSAGLWVVRVNLSAELAVPLDLGTTGPRSLAMGSDGRRYIGMRRYVLVLRPTASGWEETWYGPRRCTHSRRDERWECSCLN
jgi:hypothetical protein